MSSHLPDGTRLAYGTATAAYQVEGVHHRRRPRPVDLGHLHRPARAPSRTAATARWPARPTSGCDDDLELLAGLGVDFYRFSVAWPRVQPDRRRARSSRAGSPTTTGWSTGCSARGVAADGDALPLGPAAAARGRRRLAGARRPPSGSPTTPRSCTTTSATGCSIWATHNEPWCAAYLGYAAGVHAPGRARARRPRTAPPTTCCSATGWPRPGCTRPVPTPWASCST